MSTRTHLGHPAHRLGHIQRYVLLVLSNRGASTASGFGWWPLREDQVRGAIRGLANRGLVDVAGFENGARTYRLTRTGFEVVDQYICADDDLSDEDDDA